MRMRNIYSYFRMVIASILFMGGVAVQFVPSAAGVEREGRWRERRLQSVPMEQRSQWILDHDNEDAGTEAYVRLFGVLLGGIGLAGALLEAAFLCAQYIRRGPWDPT